MSASLILATRAYPSHCPATGKSVRGMSYNKLRSEKWHNLRLAYVEIRETTFNIGVHVRTVCETGSTNTPPQKAFQSIESYLGQRQRREILVIVGVGSVIALCQMRPDASKSGTYPLAMK